MKKKFLSILCILTALMLLLVSCGSNTQEQAGSDASKAADSAAASNEPVAEDGPMTKYEKPITITMVRNIDDTMELNIFSKLPGETIDDNRWTRLVEEKLGIKIKLNWVTKGNDEYTQKFNVSIATGDIPDVVRVNASQMKQMADAGLLADLNNVYPKYATPLSKKIIDDAGPAPLQIATIDGKLVGLPAVNANNEYVNFIWLRTDWLERDGLQPPKTMDDFINIVRTFVKNGKPGTVGMALQKGLWGADYAVLDGFFNGYHAYPQSWIEKDGKVVYGGIQPEMKQPLQVLANMYKEGLLDKEFAVKDGTKESEITISGKNGAFYAAHWNGLWPLQNARNNDPKSDWQAYPIVSADDQVAMTMSKIGTSEWTVMSKKCEHPEAIMKLFNLYVDKTFDPQNQEYVKYSNPPGTEGVWRLAPVVTYLATKNLDNYRNIQEPLKTGNPGNLFGEQLAMYENCKKFLEGDESMWGWNKTFGANSSWSVTDQYEKDKRILMNAFYGSPTPTMVEKNATLDKMQNELFIKIIMGESPVDAFDKFASDWLALGGQAMTDEVNSALGK